MKAFNHKAGLSIIFLFIVCDHATIGTVASSATGFQNELQQSSSTGWFRKTSGSPIIIRNRDRTMTSTFLRDKSLENVFRNDSNIVAEKEDAEFTKWDFLSFSWIGFVLAFMLKNF